MDFGSPNARVSLVMLYGSAAGVGFSDQSDVDIAFVAEKGVEISLETLLSMNAELQLQLHRDVDLVDIRAIGGLLHPSCPEPY